MTLFNRYFMAIAVIFALSTSVLAFYRQDKLDAYFTVYLIEYLIVTLLFVHLNRRARRLLEGMGYALFTGFGIIVALKVIAILRGP